MSRPTTTNVAATRTGSAGNVKERTTDRPLILDPYGVWADIIADKENSEFENVAVAPDGFKYDFIGGQKYFNNLTDLHCRGHFIDHDNNAKWCNLAVCPSCWVNTQLGIRKQIFRDADAWVIRATDRIGIDEIATRPKKLHALLTGRNSPQLKLAGWWVNFLPDENFKTGWSAQYVSVLTCEGKLPRVRGLVDGTNDQVGIPLSGFCTVWQETADSPEAALAVVRGSYRSPWQQIWHPRITDLIRPLIYLRPKLGRMSQTMSLRHDRVK